MSRYTRDEILDRLHKKIADKKPIIIGAAGVGLIAKTIDKAGIDIIMSYCTGPFRLNGNGGEQGYMGYCDCNDVTMEMGHMMLDRIKNTPMVAGIGCADPYRSIDFLIDEMLDIGFSGVTNCPCVGGHGGAIQNIMEEHGVGFNGEVELIRRCHDRGVFTIAYAFSEDQVRAMVQAGTDIVCPHVGNTLDKSLPEGLCTPMDAAMEKVNRLYQIAVKENPQVIVACHGGPFADPESVQYAFQHSPVQAFVGASAVERIPLEDALEETIKKYLSIQVGGSAR